MIAPASQWSEMSNPLHRAGRGAEIALIPPALSRKTGICFFAARAAAQSSIAALEITSSTSRETRGNPEFMPNASRSMLVLARNASRPAGFPLHRDIDAERPGHAEKGQFAGHPDRVVVDLLDRIRDEVDRRKT